MAKGKTYIGPKLYPWQKAVVNTVCNRLNSGIVCCVKAPRQRGKSYVCQGILLHYALNYAKTKNALISPTMAQARKIYKELVDAVYASGVIKKKNETLLEIEFINGSTIFFKSAEIRDGLRGYTVTGVLILDEAAFLSPELLELVLPWRQVSNAPMLLVSTPKIRDGVFYNYYKEGLDGNGRVVSIDWNDWDTSCLISDEMVEQYRRILTANQFKSEILGEWLDDDGMVFSFVNENLIDEAPVPFNRVYLGIDFGAGNGGDYTAISAVNENGEMVFLDFWNDLTTFQQVERIVGDIEKFGVRIASINAENNSIGSPLIDLIIKGLNDKRLNVISGRINRWVTTNKSKSELVQQMQVALEQGKIKLFNNKALVSQFTAYEAEYNPKTQVVTYNGAYGTHDDIVMSSMLAYNAYYTNQTTGQYCIGFSR